METEVNISTGEHSPLINQIAQVVLSMHKAYDNGLREYQDAIHACIYELSVDGKSIHTKREKVDYINYLKDLASRLKEMEKLLSH